MDNITIPSYNSRARLGYIINIFLWNVKHLVYLLTNATVIIQRVDSSGWAACAEGVPAVIREIT
jgi:hypothetical protein